MIPKKIHVIWVGDESKRPDACIQTWVDLNPTWEVSLWGNQDLAEYGWTNARHMREMAERSLPGLADLMRWEILYNEGGLVVDADTMCIRALPDWLSECDAFTCWDNEESSPGMLSTACVASVPNNPFFGQIILDIQSDLTVCDRPPGISTGIHRITDAWKKHQYHNLTVFPSHFFLPRHYSGASYTGPGPIYAHKIWDATVKADKGLVNDAVIEFRPGMLNENPEPFITVGMVTWNRAEYIVEAIDSVLAQDYQNFELLIVDDGSTDDTSQIISRYDDSRIRYIRKEHSGLANTRNRALKEASGNYIVWHDSDDILLPGVLSAYGKLAQTWPEVAVAYGNLIQIEAQGRIVQDLPYANHAGNKLLLARLFMRNALPMPGTMVKTAVMRMLGGFDENISASIDYDLWLRIAAERLPFLHAGIAVCKYRWHGNNASAKADSLRKEDLYILHKALAEHELRDLCADLDWHHPLQAEIAACGRIASLLQQRGDQPAAIDWLQRGTALLGTYSEPALESNR